MSAKTAAEAHLSKKKEGENSGKSPSIKKKEREKTAAKAHLSKKKGGKQWQKCISLKREGKKHD